jgi:hypothetical protein
VTPVDIAGQPLAIGDRVATLTPRYRYKLSLGTVMAFTPKGVRVMLDDESNQARPQDHRMVFPEQVVKVPGP